MATVNELVKLFLAEIKESRKPATLRQYTHQLAPFLKHFDGRQFETLLPFEIKAYLAAVSTRNGKKLAPDTIRIRITAIEQLQNFALENKVISGTIFPKLEKPPGRRRELLYEAEDIAKIQKAASPAFWLIFQALRQCGARPSELANAQIENWNREKGLIVLRDHKTATKTGVDRRIGVGAGMKKILEEATAGRTSGPLFVSTTGIPWTVDRLSQAFGYLRKKLGLQTGLVLYTARHWHATELCKKKGVHAAAEALGHKGLNTIMRYVKTTPKELQENQDCVELEPTVPPADLPAPAPGPEPLSEQQDKAA